ncbi:MAG TPA: hypothetical protein VKR06_31190 [Ktedonosporobacter sp.]|nr:hypothetical protein [Ktedonosporobacter sp.]
MHEHATGRLSLTQLVLALERTERSASSTGGMPGVEGIDLFPHCGRLHFRVDSQSQDEHDFSCPAAIL